MNSKTSDISLRITMQYRDKAKMVYELECAGAMLDVHVSPRQTPSDSDEWCVEARDGHAAGAVAISRWAATRAEALREVAHEWRSTAGTLGLRDFDWNAVEQALSAVHAL